MVEIYVAQAALQKYPLLKRHYQPEKMKDVVFVAGKQKIVSMQLCCFLCRALLGCFYYLM